MSTGAVVTIERQVEWPDTDAAGHYHHATVIRWVEAAEAALLDKLGLLELFGTVPRVHYEVDYLARLWFRDVVQIELVVAEVGRSSVRYEFTVTAGDQVAARGAMICVNAAPAEAGSAAWPEQVRAALSA
jgi:YbgC/YbaW family acyl-CoA thioester hydrolase